MSGASVQARRARGLRLLRSDAGVLDYAIAFPVVMVLILAIIQTALFMDARNAAITAAQQGADTARVQGGTIAAGDAAACAYAAAAAAGILRAPACTGTGGVSVTVTVCGTAPSLVPGLPVRACGQQRAARERFTTP